MRDQETRQQAGQEIERVARLLAGSDEPMTCSRWISTKQTAWLRDLFFRAGYQAEHGWGDFGRRRTAVYQNAACTLSISPLNQAGCFCYYGTPAIRERLSRERREAAIRQEAYYKAGLGKDRQKWAEALAGLRSHLSSLPSGHPDEYATKAWITVFEALLKSSNDATAGRDPGGEPRLSGGDHG